MRFGFARHRVTVFQPSGVADRHDSVAQGQVFELKRLQQWSAEIIHRVALLADNSGF
jgi:hypothetical protein